jgi:oligopeptide/dipeptide ABC transporter ATP-binding protein
VAAAGCPDRNAGAGVVTLLSVENLRTEFPTSRGILRAVDGVSFSLKAGEVLGFVGESGSGKSITALSLLRLVPKPGRITADSIRFAGTDLLVATERDLRRLRTKDIGVVFQDPLRSLNPVLTIGRQLTETLRRHLGLSGADARKRAVELLDMVGIPLASKRLSSYPHEFSGGMRQRVMIAIALSCNPRLLIADEATTALDVTVQAQIIELLRTLIRELDIAVIWISHDLGLVAQLCDRVNVMYAGRVVESGPVRQVFRQPSHAYTVGLIASTPRLDRVGHRLSTIEGLPPDTTQSTGLCAFLPRCRVSVDRCRHVLPDARPVGQDHLAACFADEGRLREGLPQ